MLSRTADGATTFSTFDANGNRLTAVSATGTITTTYDRLNRPLTVSVSSDSGAGTTYTYSLTAPSWTDPTGSYTATLDAFDREVALADPIHGSSTFTTTYRADGQPASMSAPNGNATTFGYDGAGRESSRSTTATGSVNRASYTWTHNASGHLTADALTSASDPTAGTTTYAYDPLGRLTGWTPPAVSAKTYGWDAVPNRTSVQTGAGTPVTYSFDAANRLTSDSAGGSYTFDADGRLTVRPGQRLEWDALARLTKVKPPSGNSAIATYTYDALDRLLLADYGGSNRTRFRYVGLTTVIAQEVDDASGNPIRSIANDWTGNRLLDWTGSGTSQRFYGTDLRHDVTWLADSTGAVIATLRYDPFGTVTSSTGGSLPDFRFQGSLYDPAVDLSWVVTRWYAPDLGQFISEDSLLGTPVDPPSRNLYAYAQADPIDGWDPDGRFWYRWQAGDTIGGVATRYLGLWGTVGFQRRYAIYTVNKNRANVDIPRTFYVGQCIWVPREVWIASRISAKCSPSSTLRTGFIGDIYSSGDLVAKAAAQRVLGNWTNWYLMDSSQLYLTTTAQTKRNRDPSGYVVRYQVNQQYGVDYAILGFLANRWSHKALFLPAKVYILWGQPWWTPLGYPSGADAVTYGNYIMLRSGLDPDHITYELLSHEYIHVLQWQGRGVEFASSYLRSISSSFDPGNSEEAIAYLWQKWVHYYHRYGGLYPWQVFKPLPLS
jgi:RHS repeat-associated protein